MPGHKNEFLGAALPCLMFLSAMEMMIYLGAASRSVATALPRYAGGLPLISLLIAGVALFRWPAHFTELGHFLPQQEVRQQRELLESIYRGILRSGEGPARVLFTQSGPYLNPQLLQYRSGRDRIREVDCVDRAMTGDPDELEDELAVASDVIAFSPGNRNAMQWLPAARIQRQVLDRLRGHPRFFLDAAYASPGGGEVFPFTQRLGFRGIRPIAGLGAIEGPYPQWAMTFKVRWGLGPESRFEIDVPPTGGVRLILEGISSLPGQTMTVRVSGSAVGEHRFASLDNFERIELDLERSPGSHVVELQYSQWYQPDEHDDRPRAVLFRTLLALDADRQ